MLDENLWWSMGCQSIKKWAKQLELDADHISFCQIWNEIYLEHSSKCMPKFKTTTLILIKTSSTTGNKHLVIYNFSMNRISMERNVMCNPDWKSERTSCLLAKYWFQNHFRLVSFEVSNSSVVIVWLSSQLCFYCKHLPVMKKSFKRLVITSVKMRRFVNKRCWW